MWRVNADATHRAVEALERVRVVVGRKLAGGRLFDVRPHRDLEAVAADDLWLDARIRAGYRAVGLLREALRDFHLSRCAEPASWRDASNGVAGHQQRDEAVGVVQDDGVIDGQVEIRRD